MSILQQMEKKDDSKPWKEICSRSCWVAKHDRCRCKCKKKNHGRGLMKRLTDMEEKKDEDDKSASPRTTS